jgi:hypothetical protein
MRTGASCCVSDGGAIIAALSSTMDPMKGFSMMEETKEDQAVYNIGLTPDEASLLLVIVATMMQQLVGKLSQLPLIPTIRQISEIKAMEKQMGALEKLGDKLNGIVQADASKVVNDDPTHS